MKVVYYIIISIMLIFTLSCKKQQSNQIDFSQTPEISTTISNEIKYTETITIKPTTIISPAPSPAPTPVPYVNLSDENSFLTVRKGPGTNTKKLGTLNNSDPVTILELGDVWHKIDYEGQQAYVFAAYIKDVAVQYAYVPRLEASVDGKTYISNMVDVRTIIPDIKIWLTFASQDNVMGKVLYPVLQESTAKRLAKANEIFKKDGFRIKLYDGYRPYSVSVYLYEEIKDGRFVANPKKNPSTHNRGVAVDITLERIDTGNEISMPSKMHTFNISSLRSLPNIRAHQAGSQEYEAILKKYPDILDYPPRTTTAIKNMNYMTNVMKESGFTTITTEWWHFNDIDKMKFMVLDYDLVKDIIWIPEDEYQDFMDKKAMKDAISDLPDYVIFPIIEE